MNFKEYVFLFIFPSNKFSPLPESRLSCLTLSPYVIM